MKCRPPYTSSLDNTLPQSPKFLLPSLPMDFPSLEELEQPVYEENHEYSCTVMIYDYVYNAKGERIRLEASKKRERDFETKSKGNHESALDLTRIYTLDKELEKTSLTIKSPLLIRALREVIQTYPEVNFNSQRIVLEDIPMCLFHYRKQLQEYGAGLTDPIAAQQLLFLLRFMYHKLQYAISDYYHFIESPSKTPGLEFENLWMVFRPGTLVYNRNSTNNNENVYRCDRIYLRKSRFPEYERWIIVLHKITHDGSDFGFSEVIYYLKKYKGYKPLVDLKVFPLEYHPRQNEIRQKMIARGRRFVALKGSHHREYEGTANALSPFGFMREEYEPSWQPTRIKSRIMVDCNTFTSEVPVNEIDLLSSPQLVLDKTEDGEEVLSEDELMICDDEIPGFAFTTKQWCWFRVDLINDVKFSSDAFGALILPEGQKDIISSLVAVHTDERLAFDDLIRGKGKGMIFLLHGVPGVGKTLTAESVADYTRRPLYTISAGELGGDVQCVEKNLSSALALATTWNAIILIDEADVFLEQRTSSDLARNTLVSIFLRLLEYYEGIMFLTTNRVGAFDSAFKSRIHLAIRYPELTKNSRRDLFKMFINSASRDGLPYWVDDVSLDRLAAGEFNGRQIKNAVRTAYALAVRAGKELDIKHIEMALSAMKSFETNFQDEEEQVPKDIAESSGRSKRQRIS